VGPLLAALSGTAIGPLSVLPFLVLAPPPELAAVQATCADPASVDDCLSLRFRRRLSGIGPAIMSILPALLLLVLADGLRRGLTLGGLDELADEQVRCLVAIDTDRTVHGITSWLPIYTDGKITGWTLTSCADAQADSEASWSFSSPPRPSGSKRKARSCSACPGRP
jgi:hypothetical protein